MTHTGEVPQILRPAATVRMVLAMALLLLLFVVFALTVGPYSIDLATLFQIVIGTESGPGISTAREVLLQIRLPRVIMAASVGAGLSMSGLMFQLLLRNVLADPYILGVSGGASVGALLAIVTGASAVSMLMQPLFAFIGALLVVFLVAVIGLRSGTQSNTLLLSGVMIGAFLSSVILVLVSTTDKSIRSALFWLIGYLGNTTTTHISIVAPAVLIVGIAAVMISGKMNIMALGESTAAHLGIEIRQMRNALFFLASMSTAVVVSFAGAIGFVGLIIPHACRLLTGPDHRLLLPAVFFTGAAFTIFSDILARTVVHPVELPVGAVTAALGAPVFLLLLLRTKR
jgi:iron complex transport system permease protein